MNFEQLPQPNPTEDALPNKDKQTEPLDTTMWHRGKTIPAFPPNKQEDTPRKTVELLPHEIESVLESREVEAKNDLNGGCNESVILKLKDDGSGVFKPRSGEKPDLRSSIPAGTHFLKESAAYTVDKALGLEMIPPTVIREVDGEPGSIQKFIPDAKTGNELDYQELHSKQDELRRLQVLDYILWNSDRHYGNLLVKDDKIYAIDNGLCFGNDGASGFDLLYTGKIPDDIKEKIEGFANDNEEQRELRDALEILVPMPQVAACIRRIQTIGSLSKEFNGKVPPEAALEFAYNG